MTDAVTNQKAGIRADDSPWAIASGAEWFKDYPKFNPLLRDAGVRWLRYFPEWQAIQPKQGVWNWDPADHYVNNSRENNIQIAGVFAYFAPWASADGGTRRGPIKDMQFWRDYVRGVTERYRDDIRYWEVWNEFNGSFYQGKNKPKEYADLVVAAYETAKSVDPDIKIGLSVANFDVNFLDQTIKAGAADHFDYIAVHPYENTGAIADGGEVGYLSLVGNLRDMLKANGQSEDIPLWITEFGYQVSIKPNPESEAKQANILTKSFILSLVQGFERMCWFEARGPSYGHNTDHGLIRKDWTLRPSYHALKTMTTLLGQSPEYAGWLNLGTPDKLGGYGFMFQGADGPVLAAWAPPGEDVATSYGPGVQVTNQYGKSRVTTAHEPLKLTREPVYITNPSAELVRQARENIKKPYPWGGDYANAKVVTNRLGVTNIADGLKQVKPKTTKAVNMLDHSFRQTDFSFGNEGRYVYFRVDPQFVPFGTRELNITIVARRAAPDKRAGMGLTYESDSGYKNSTQEWWTIPEDGEWHEHTWTVQDANFVGQWGWNFRFDGVSSPNEFQIKEVRVTKGN